MSLLPLLLLAFLLLPLVYTNLDVEKIRTRAGQDLLWKFAVTDDAGAVVDIAGWTFELWAVDQADASNSIIVENASFSITDHAGGLVQCPMARALTVNQGGKTFTVTLWRIDSGSNDDLCEGDWVILRTARPAA